MAESGNQKPVLKAMTRRGATYPAQETSMDRAQPECSNPVALVVEDDAAVRDLATAVLEETDLGVIACDSAEAALSVLERPDVNVALLFADIRLPGAMDG